MVNDSPSSTRKLPSMRPAFNVGLCRDTTASLMLVGKTSLSLDASAVLRFHIPSAPVVLKFDANLDASSLVVSFSGDDLDDWKPRAIATWGTNWSIKA